MSWRSDNETADNAFSSAVMKALDSAFHRDVNYYCEQRCQLDVNNRVTLWFQCALLNENDYEFHFQQMTSRYCNI